LIDEEEERKRDAYFDVTKLQYRDLVKICKTFKNLIITEFKKPNLKVIEEEAD